MLEYPPAKFISLLRSNKTSMGHFWSDLSNIILIKLSINPYVQLRKCNLFNTFGGDVAKEADTLSGTDRMPDGNEINFRLELTRSNLVFCTKHFWNAHEMEKKQFRKFVHRGKKSELFQGKKIVVSGSLFFFGRLLWFRFWFVSLLRMQRKLTVVRVTSIHCKFLIEIIIYWVRTEPQHGTLLFDD